MKRTSLATFAAICFLGTPAVAEKCNLAMALAEQGKELGTTMGVTKRDAGYYEALGLTLKKGVFGTYYIETADLVDKLETKDSCPSDLVDKVARRAKPIPAGSAPKGLTDQERARLILEGKLSHPLDGATCQWMPERCPKSAPVSQYRNQVAPGPKTSFEAIWK